MSLSDLQLPDTFDLFMLALRTAFIALIYFFLYQVARVCIRELVVLGKASAVAVDPRPEVPSPTSGLVLLDPAESSFDVGTEFPLDHYTTIGRHRDNSVALDDSFVSGSHAEIIFESGSWWLHDMNSTNGTFINDQPVRGRVRIANGDIIQFGRVTVRAHV